jgi:hypothetical protein
MRLRYAIGLCVAAVAMPAANAHHSPVMFDQTRTVSVSGTVRQFQWSNPHCYIQLVDDAQTEWSLEMGAPIYLANHGWRPSTLRAGDRVKVTAAPLRSGASGGLVLEVVSLEGKVIGKVK